MTLTNGIPNVSKRGFLDMQVCVPKDWTDEQILAFAEQENPCGTTAGWVIRREGSVYLAGDPERRQCEELPDHIHVMLDA